MLPVACGLALAAQLRGERRVAAAFTGDGATSEGDFHEALNLAAVWKLPVIFVVENNQWGLSTPAHEQYACRNLADRGIGYGMPGLVVDGNDLLGGGARGAPGRRAGAPRRRADAARVQDLQDARPRGGLGHRLRPEAGARGVGEEGPGEALRGLLLERGLCDEAELASDARGAYRQRIDTLVDEALEAEEPRSSRRARSCRTCSRPACSSRGRHGRGARPRRRSCATWTRSATALRVAMRRDERVVLFGQDIAEYGGVFKVTEGFVAEFGKARVRNTPIIESGAIGARDRPGARRLRADGRDAVRRLHHLRLQPDREQPRQDALALGRRACRS